MNKQKMLEAITPEVKKALKSPYSAVFCPPEELRVAAEENNRYRVYGYVDSQNTYGGMMRTEFEYSVLELSNGTYLAGYGGVGDQRPTVVKERQQAELKAINTKGRTMLYSLLVVAIIMVIYILVRWA